MRSKLQMILWCAALVVGLWFLHSVGRGDLATPPAPQLWSRWSDDVGPAAAIVATLRVLALVAGWYLLVLTVVGSVGHRFRIRPIMTATETVSPRFLNRLVAGARGLTISAAGLTLAVAPLLAHGRGVPVPTARVAEVSVATLTQTGVPTTATLARLAPDPSTARLERLELAFVPAFEAPSVREAWIVATGEHFWGIASEILRDRLDRTPTEAETAVYWLELIEANRELLLVRDNPDLIYPGQRLDLPRHQ